MVGAKAGEGSGVVQKLGEGCGAVLKLGEGCGAVLKLGESLRGGAETRGRLRADAETRGNDPSAGSVPFRGFFAGKGRKVGEGLGWRLFRGFQPASNVEN